MSVFVGTVAALTLTAATIAAVINTRGGAK